MAGVTGLHCLSDPWPPGDPCRNYAFLVCCIPSPVIGTLPYFLVSHKFTHVSHGGVDRRESGAKTEALTTFRSSGSGSFGAPVACGTILVAINGIVTNDATLWKFCTSS